MAWQTPVSLSVSPDHSSYSGIRFVDPGAVEGGTGVVQFALGLHARLTIVTDGGNVDVIGQEATGHVVHGVREVVHTPSATSIEPAQPDPDATVLTPVGVLSETTVEAETPVEAEAEAEAEADSGDGSLSGAVGEDDFDATVIGESGGESVVEASDDVGDAGTTAAPPILRLTVIDANGPRVVGVEGDLYVGRAPRVPSERRPDDGSLVVVASRTAHVSATHLQLTQARGRLLVRDLWSTNGTMLAPPNAAAFRLEPGEILPVVAGTRIVLADDVIVDVSVGDVGTGVDDAQ